MKHTYWPIILTISLVFLLGLSSQAQTTISIDFNTQRFIGNTSSFDRTKYINMHENFDTWDLSLDELKYLADTLDIGFGRNVGNTRWEMGKLENDPSNPNFPNPSMISSEGQASINGFQNRGSVIPYNTDQMVFTSHITPIFPNSVTAANPPNGYVPQDASGSASFLRQFFQHYFAPDLTQPGRVRPAYYEVMNEPFVHRFEYNTTVTEMSTFHKVVADSLHAAFPTMKVGGPTSAWPEYERGGFSVWSNQGMKTFIDVAGADMDFLSFHIYDTPGNVLTAETGSIRGGSNVEAIMDLTETYSKKKLGIVKPMMISEYGACCGGQGWDGPYSAYRDWRILKSTNALLMSFLKRENKIEKTIPFITGKAKWWLNSHADPYPHVVYIPDGPNWKLTHLIKWYQFWNGVSGDRVKISSDDPDMQLEAFTKGDRAFVFLNNFDFGNHTVDIQTANLSAADVQSVRIKRLFLNENTQVPVLSEETLNTPPQQLTLRGEESILLEYIFQSPQAIQDTVWEDRFYTSTYLQPINAGSLNNFQFDEVSTPNTGEGRIRISIGRAHGKSLAPEVSINGTNVPVPTDWMGYDQQTREDFFGMIEVPFDVSLLNEQTTVGIRFPDGGGHIASVVLALSSSEITITSKKPKIEQGSFEVYPNPTQGHFHILLPKTLRQQTEILILDLQGREILKESYLPDPSGEIIIQLPPLVPAMYIVQARSKNWIGTNKIILN